MPSAAKLQEEKATQADRKAPSAEALSLTFSESALDLKDMPHVGGASRPPNPFDGVVKLSYDTGKSFEAPVKAPSAGDLGAHVDELKRLLRNAAKYHECGIDIRVLNDTSESERKLWFKARKRHARKAGEAKS